MNDYTNKKDDEQMMSEPEYFEIRPSIREMAKFTHYIGEKCANYPGQCFAIFPYANSVIEYIYPTLLNRQKKYRI